jgi:hypothetical protein
VTSLLSHPTLNEWGCLQAVYALEVGLIRNVTFRKECYYRAKKHFREDLILP